MVWKSRENAYPKKDFLARLLAHLRLAYPGAELTEEVLRELWPFILNEWRHGKDERGVATSTCSCDGVRIVPSPGVLVALTNKRIVRAPKDAQPNQVFGLDAVRASPRITKLRIAMQTVQEKLKIKDEAFLSLEMHLPRARSEKRRQDLLQRQKAILAEKEALARDLEEMQNEYAEKIRGAEEVIERLRIPEVTKKASSSKKAEQATTKAEPKEPKPTRSQAKTEAKAKDAKPAAKSQAKPAASSTGTGTAEGCGCQTPDDAGVPDVTAQDLTGLLNNLAGELDPREMAGLAKSEGV